MVLNLVGYDQYVAMLKGYHAAFDNIKYTAENWLPGTSEDGSLDGSVRTYGTWTGTNVSTGKELNLKGYWYMNFDDEGKIIAQGDFFDFGGMMDAVYSCLLYTSPSPRDLTASRMPSSA